MRMGQKALGVGLGCVALVGALACVACLTPPVLRPRDAPPDDAQRTPPALLSTGLEVRSFDGRLFSPEATPRRPRFVLTTVEPFEGEIPIYLVAGEPDDALLDDLTTSPLRREHLDRTVPCALTVDGTSIELVPTAPLRPGERYTIAIAAWATAGRMRLGTPFTRTITVGTAPELGAEAVLAWPPDGAFDVGTEPWRLLVAFDGALRSMEGIGLFSADGEVEVDRRAVDCVAYGVRGRCVALLPTSALARRTEHHLVVDGTLDATGAPVPAFEARFLTAAEPDDDAPALAPLECFPDELDQDGVCVRVGDRDLAVRARLLEPVRAVLFVDRRAAAALGPRGEVELVLGHDRAGEELGLAFVLEDLAGNVLELPMRLSAPGPLPRLAITEVRADPRGPEPAQEYVELLNEGEVPLELGDFWFADDLGREGDRLPSAWVPPRARVLVVADAFDPDEPTDAPTVPAGLPLVRIGTSLGDGGLSSAGEPLVLRWRDESGLWHRVSELPAMRSPEPGACLARSGTDFVFDRTACSPGTE